MRLLLIGGGHAQLTLAEEASALDVEVVLADDRPHVPARGLATQIISIHRYDEEELLKEASRLQLDAVVSGGSDLGVAIMARLARHLGLKTYLTPEAAELPMEKGRMRQLYARLGLPGPENIETESMDGARAFMGRLGRSIVVKPVDGIAQAGVTRVDALDDLDAAFEGAIRSSSAGRVVVEEFLDGMEVDANAFVIDGHLELLTIGQRVTNPQGGEDFGVTLAKLYPAEEAEPYRNEIQNTLARVVDHVGIKNAPIYAQILLTRDGPRIVEMMPRISGGEDPRLILQAVGFNSARATVLAAMGQPLDRRQVAGKTRHGGAVIRFMTAAPGVIREIHGLAEARMSTGIVNADMYYGPGHELGPLRSSRERLGFVLAVGEDRPQAEERAEHAISTVRIMTSP